MATAAAERERFAKRVVEHRVAGAIDDRRQHDRILLASAPASRSDCRSRKPANERRRSRAARRRTARLRQRRRRRAGIRRAPAGSHRRVRFAFQAASNRRAARRRFGSGISRSFSSALKMMRSSSGGMPALNCRRRRRLLREQALEDRRHRRALETAAGRRHFVEHDARGEQVAARIDLLSARLFRRHVRHRADRRPHGRQLIGRRQRRVEIPGAAHSPASTSPRRSRAP